MVVKGQGGSIIVFNSPASDSSAEISNLVVACDALSPALAVENAMVDDVEMRHTAEIVKREKVYTMLVMVAHQAVSTSRPDRISQAPNSRASYTTGIGANFFRFSCLLACGRERL